MKMMREKSFTWVEGSLIALRLVQRHTARRQQEDQSVFSIFKIEIGVKFEIARKLQKQQAFCFRCLEITVQQQRQRW